MGNLVLAITANTIMIFAMKSAENHGSDKKIMILFNYLFGGIIAVILSKGFAGLEITLEEVITPIALGLFNAFLMVSCMMTQQSSICKNGAGLTTTYNRLGVLIPTILSIFIFKEYPSWVKVLGILISVLAILYSYDKGNNSKSKKYHLLWLVLAMGGLIDFNSKILGMACEANLKDVYTVSTFAFSMVIMLVIVLVKKTKPNKVSIKYGALIGIPNICITFGMVRAASQLPSYIVFPVYSGAVILLVNGIGAMVFKEKLSKREKISTIMIAIALILLNI